MNSLTTNDKVIRNRQKTTVKTWRSWGVSICRLIFHLHKNIGRWLKKNVISSDEDSFIICGCCCCFNRRFSSIWPFDGAWGRGGSVINELFILAVGARARYRKRRTPRRAWNESTSVCNDHTVRKGAKFGIVFISSLAWFPQRTGASFSNATAVV